MKTQEMEDRGDREYSHSKARVDNYAGKGETL